MKKLTTLLLLLISIATYSQTKYFSSEPLVEYKDKEFPKFNSNTLTDGKFDS